MTSTSLQFKCLPVSLSLSFCFFPLCPCLFLFFHSQFLWSHPFPSNPPQTTTASLYDSPSVYFLVCCCLHRQALNLVIHLAATVNKHVAADRRPSPGLEEQERVDRLTWVGRTLVLTSVHQCQPLGQMVRSRALTTVHQMRPLALSCLAVAPSIMSQWN